MKTPGASVVTSRASSRAVATSGIVNVRLPGPIYPV